MEGVRCLVLSVDIGAGHRRAAEAVCETMQTLRPESTHQVVEALDYLGAGAGKLAKDLYFGMLEDAPGLWGALYEERGLVDLFRPIGQFLDELRASKLVPVARDFAPDVLLAMHPIACGLASALARNGDVDCPVVAVLTDFDGHPAWIGKGIDLYLVATEQVKEDLERHGLPTGSVTVTGLPLRPAFETIRAGLPQREVLGLDPARFTILLLGGGLGLGPILETAEALGAIDGPIQLVLISGRNEELETKASALARRCRAPLHVTGLVENMWDYMKASDLAVGKPGGLTCAELLAVGVPLIALSPIPGQEQANCDALVQKGVAIQAMSPSEALAAVEGVLSSPPRLETMRQAALRLGRPTAARLAAQAVFSVIEAWPTLRYRQGDSEGGDPFSLKSEAFRLFDKIADTVEGIGGRRTRRRTKPSKTEKDSLEKQFEEKELDEELEELKKDLGVE